jgi:hypothetical protein
MKKSHNIGRNSASVSVRNAPAQIVLSDTDEDEKTQPPIVDIDALKRLAAIARAIKARVGVDPDTGENINDSK